MGEEKSGGEGGGESLFGGDGERKKEGIDREMPEQENLARTGLLQEEKERRKRGIKYSSVKGTALV